jgi:hypothetical protein
MRHLGDAGMSVPSAGAAFTLTLLATARLLRPAGT